MPKIGGNYYHDYGIFNTSTSDVNENMQSDALFSLDLLTFKRRIYIFCFILSHTLHIIKLEIYFIKALDMGYISCLSDVWHASN